MIPRSGPARGPHRGCDAEPPRWPPPGAVPGRALRWRCRFHPCRPPGLLGTPSYGPACAPRSAAIKRMGSRGGSRSRAGTPRLESRVSEHVEQVQQLRDAALAHAGGPFVARPEELCHRVPPPRFRCSRGRSRHRDARFSKGRYGRPCRSLGGTRSRSRGKGWLRRWGAFTRKEGQDETSVVRDGRFRRAGRRRL